MLSMDLEGSNNSNHSINNNKSNIKGSVTKAVILVIITSKVVMTDMDNRVDKNMTILCLVEDINNMTSHLLDKLTNTKLHLTHSKANLPLVKE